MPIIDYPDWLPLAQKASKNMTLDTGFQTDQPAVGPAIFESNRRPESDTVTDVDLHSVARARFPAVATQPELSQPRPELVPMNINLGGSGLQLQELHFTQMPVQTSIDGGVVTDGNRYCQPPVQRR